MNKEELKQEAEKLYEDWFAHKLGAISIIGVICKMAEPREKRIEELEEAKANLEYLLEGRDNEIDELKKENKVLAQNLEDTEICENGWKNRVKELEAQIEKIKCCGNCKSYDMTYLPYYCNKKNEPKHCNSKCDEWEIKEK